MTELMPSLCNDCVARNQCGKDDVKMCISYTKEIKIKCDDCKFVDDCVDYGWEGCRKFTPAPSEPQTNEEWFSGMYTEAKAEWLADHMKCSKCPQQNRCNGYHGGCVALMLEWLKQPHND